MGLQQVTKGGIMQRYPVWICAILSSTPSCCRFSFHLSQRYWFRVLSNALRRRLCLHFAGFLL